MFFILPISKINFVFSFVEFVMGPREVDFSFFFLCINFLFIYFSLSFFFPLACNFSFLYYYFSHLISISFYFCALINNADKTDKTGSLEHRVGSGRVKATRHYHPRAGRQSVGPLARPHKPLQQRSSSSSCAAEAPRSLARSGSLSLSLQLQLRFSKNL